mmetsp:Transcript_41329/g.74740  ORF Transcript_41329/g.74740 Transcript_41329/m.74740 type:complete len:379 (-) Transcript_41329:105-1241(-)
MESDASEAWLDAKQMSLEVGMARQDSGAGATGATASSMPAESGEGLTDMPSSGRSSFFDSVRKGASSFASIYALEPHPMWLERRGPVLMFGGLYTFVAVVCILAQHLGFETVRFIYSAMAMFLLLYRMAYYKRKGWLLFFIDLCFVTSEVLVLVMWLIDSAWCSTDFLVSVYLAATGPVAGASFLLNIPLVLHHAEAFESWFLHGTPMWVCSALRWTFHRLPPRRFGTSDLVWLGLSQFYARWVLFYLAFLLAHPWMPRMVAEMEVIMDGFLYADYTSPSERVKAKRQNYPSYFCYTVAYTLGHAVLSLSGFLAAALSYQCHATQVCWIVVVQVGGLILGVQFYINSTRSRPMPGMVAGFGRMLLAWAVVAPTHLLAC